MKRGNCFVYALAQWLEHGGYVAVRRCKLYPFCIHWLHSTDLKQWTSYTAPNDGAGLGWFGKLWYVGFIKEGDE